MDLDRKLRPTLGTPLLLLLLLCPAWLSGCRDSGGVSPASSAAEQPGIPATADHSLSQTLKADKLLERHPSDGAGRAWFEKTTPPARAVVGVNGRWTIIYEVGPLGIAEGGAIYLQGSPFWGWSPPQVVAADIYGYTQVSTDATGVRSVLQSAAKPRS